MPIVATVNGTISTDGAFVTLTMGAQRKHFVVAMDDLPLLRSPLTVLPDGSLQVDLVLPGGEPLLLKVPSGSAIEAEKAIALITSIQRSKGGSIGGQLGAHPVLATGPQRELDYQMSGWSEQDLSAALQELRERGIVGRLAGKSLTVPFSDQIATDDVIKIMRAFNSPSPTRNPVKFLDGKPYVTAPTSIPQASAPRVSAATNQMPQSSFKDVVQRPNSPNAASSSAAAIGSSTKPKSTTVALIGAAVAAGLIVVAVIASTSGDDGSSTAKKNSANGAEACRLLKKYAFQGFPTLYIDEGVGLLDATGALFVEAGRPEVSSRLINIAGLMTSGLSGQMAAKTQLGELANSVC